MLQIIQFKIVRIHKVSGVEEVVARFPAKMRKEAELSWDSLRYVSQGSVECNAHYQQFEYRLQTVYAS